MTLERVAYVVNVFPKVSETFIANELAELRRRRIDIRILSLRRPSEDLRHRMVDRAELPERVVYERDEFVPTLEVFRPELIHAHFATAPTETAIDLAERFDLPMTFTAHRYDIYQRPPADFAARAAAADAMITVSRANARYIGEKFGVPIDRIEIISAGVDLEKFRPGGRPASPPVVLAVARLHPAKNLPLLLNACALLVRRGIRFRCSVVGEGRERSHVERLCRDLDLESVVELPGAADHDDVAALWRRASVAVLSSDSEGMPVSLMEAAASGVPAVATTVGGVPELVEDGVTGLLVPAGDAHAVAVALETLLRDEEVRVRMGEAARIRAEERFSIERQVDRLLAVWERVLNERATESGPGARSVKLPENFAEK